ncbi:hypothetical protein Mpsy_2309 [Methanolobus psychrophilus R15]|nr:hypothetical protein Mpsy_2309 [Methanolobus psychrophilus R15]
MNTSTINPEVQRKARETYLKYKEVIDSDAVHATGWNKAVARTYIQLAGYDVGVKSAINEA